MCKSISIIIAPSFISLYNNEYQEYLLRIKEINYNKEKMRLNKRQKNKLKVRNIIRGIKPEFEKLKPHYSFSAGENEIENINYFYYSDDEEKKSVINKDIKNYLNNKNFLKNDFFLYLNERETNDKLEQLEVEIDVDKLSKDKTFNITLNAPNGITELSETQITVKVTLDSNLRVYKYNLSYKFSEFNYNGSYQLDTIMPILRMPV
jgi:hypothetical protein